MAPAATVLTWRFGYRELEIAGIPAQAVGHDFFTPETHVAVVAYDDEHRYLCDLGDQWIMPIPIDAHEMTAPIAGFFPAAKVALHTIGSQCVVTSHRPSGKVNRQSHWLQKIPNDALLRTANYSQGLLRRPLCELRIPLDTEVARWEFYDGSSFLSTGTGLSKEPPAESTEEWIHRIHARTGISPLIIASAMEAYSQ